VTEETQWAPHLPFDWIWTEVGEISETTTGTTPSKKDSDNYGDYLPFVKPPELNDCVIDKASDNLSRKGAESARVLPPKSILVSCIGTIGKTGINRVPVAINQQINAIVFYFGVIPEFGFYYFQYAKAKKYLTKIASATTIPIVNKSKFNTTPFPLAPTNEQVRIVKKIEELFSFLDAGVASLRKVQTQLKHYRQAVLKYAFEGKLTKEWRRTHKDQIEPAQRIVEKKGHVKAIDDAFVNDILLNRLPEDWVWIRLSTLIGSMKNGIYKPKSFYNNNGCACLRMYNIEGGVIVWKDIKRMNLSNEEIAEYGLKAGDILVNRVNSRELVGKSAVIPEGLETCVYESKNIRLRLLQELADSGYVNFWILYNGQKYFNRNAQQTVGMASINQEQLGLMLIPYCSLKEQQEISKEIERHFSVAEESRKTLELSLLECERLRQSILKKAFEGALVPQDPTDEPAEKLLSRIKVERFNDRKSKMNNQLELTRYVK
jgi:type I restriction enzyme S subunit